MALVVVHRYYQVECAAESLKEDGVGRMRACGGDSFGLRRFDGRSDGVCVLIAEQAMLARVRVEPAHGDPWLPDTQQARGFITEFDSSQDAAGVKLASEPQRYVGSYVDHSHAFC